MPKRVIRDSSAPPFVKGSVKPLRTLYDGDEAFLYGYEKDLSRMIMRIAPQGKTRATWTIFDSDAGVSVAQTSKPIRTFSDTELLVRHNGDLAVVSYFDGSMLTVKPKLPKNKLAARWWFLGNDAVSQRWILAMTSKKEFFVGPWRERLLQPLLSHPLSEFSSYRVHDNKDGSLELTPTPTGDCPIYLLNGTEVECLQEPQEATWRFRLAPDRETVIAEKAGRKLEQPFPCQLGPDFLVTLRGLSTLLLCTTARDLEQWLWWGPGGVYGLTLPSKQTHHTISLTSTRLHSLGLFVGKKHTDVWLDLQDGVHYRYEGGELEDLHQSTETRVLAARKKGMDQELVVLDLPSLTAFHALDAPCNGKLFASGTKSYSILRCNREIKKGIWRFEVQWTKYVDVDKGRYYDLPGYLEMVVGPDTLLLSNRTVYAEESYEHATKFFLVTLE